MRDTLSNGKIIVRSSQARPIASTVDEQETYLRQKPIKAITSTIVMVISNLLNYGESESDDADKKLTKCNSPKHNVTTDSLGSMVRKYDKSMRTTQ
jgi:hypothetical protein